MKRSSSISLVLMGALALGPTGCGNEQFEESYTTFTSMNECVTSGLFSEEECKGFLRDAVAETPRFSSQAECEAKFGAGACAPPSAAQGKAAPTDPDGASASVEAHSGSLWMPMLMGFMAGRFLSGGGPMQGSQGLYGKPEPGAQGGPDKTRSFRTASGATVQSDAKGRVSNPSSSLKQSLSHNAKPALGRGAATSKGGFSGGAKFSGAAS